MVEYELAVGTQGITPEDAMSEYGTRVTAAYEAHRTEIAVFREGVILKLAEAADEYYEIGKAFRKDDTPPEDGMEENGQVSSDIPDTVNAETV